MTKNVYQYYYLTIFHRGISHQCLSVTCMMFPMSLMMMFIHSGVTCSSNGQCEVKGTTATCNCSPGYTGQQCEITVNGCTGQMFI